MNKNILRKLGFGPEVDAYDHGFCPLCGTPICMSDFRDEPSKREYKISGMCQKCQDGNF